MPSERVDEPLDRDVGLTGQVQGRSLRFAIQSVRAELQGNRNSQGRPHVPHVPAVGNPFKDTSSVAMNPIIKFTTLFGLLAVELALELDSGTKLVLAAVFFLVSLVFVRRSFYGMRIGGEAA